MAPQQLVARFYIHTTRQIKQALVHWPLGCENDNHEHDTETIGVTIPPSFGATVPPTAHLLFYTRISTCRKELRYNRSPVYTPFDYRPTSIQEPRCNHSSRKPNWDISTCPLIPTLGIHWISYDRINRARASPALMPPTHAVAIWD